MMKSAAADVPVYGGTLTYSADITLTYTLQ